MNTCIYDKTDKGREEIATRRYQVPAKLRTLLVMIDGRHSLESLLKHFAVLGLSNDHVDTLEQQGFIALIAGGSAEEEDEDTSPTARPPASARARMLARTAARHERLAGEATASQPPAGEPAPVAEAPADDFAMPDTPAPRRGGFNYFNLASDSVNFSES